MLINDFCVLLLREGRAEIDVSGFNHFLIPFFLIVSILFSILFTKPAFFILKMPYSISLHYILLKD